MNIKRICTMFFSILFVGGINFVNAMDDKKQERSSKCNICFQELKWNEINNGVVPTIATPACNHSFHRDCLKKYIYDYQQLWCPVCEVDMDKDGYLQALGLVSSSANTNDFSLAEFFRLIEN